MSNSTYSRRQFITLGLGVMGGTAVLGLAGCSDGPAATSGTAATSGAAASATGIDKDAFNALVASVEPAADDVIAANPWASAIKSAGKFRLGATRTSTIFSQPVCVFRS